MNLDISLASALRAEAVVWVVVSELVPVDTAVVMVAAWEAAAAAAKNVISVVVSATSPVCATRVATVRVVDSEVATGVVLVVAEAARPVILVAATVTCLVIALRDKNATTVSYTPPHLRCLQ